MTDRLTPSALELAVFNARLRRGLLGRTEHVTLGRYRIDRLLGKGGFGHVYAAHDTALDRRVAVKVLTKTLNERAVRRAVIREGAGLASVSHDNVVEVFDVAVERGLGLLVMEYVEGQTLEAWIANHRHSPADRLRAMQQASDGVAAVHRAGVCHGDIKPGNFLVDDAGAVKLTDFGLSRILEEIAESTEPGSSGSIHGFTRRYRAPELDAGARADYRSDQYALALTLDEILRRGEPLPRRIQQAIARGLAVDPRARWPTVADLAARLRAPSRRRILPWVAAGVVAAGLCLAIGLSSRPRAVCDLQREAAVRDRQVDRVRSRLLDASEGSAANVGPDVAASISAYARALTSNRRGMCQPTVRGAALGEVVTPREACLNRARLRFDELIELLSADAKLDPRRVQLGLSSLPDVARCSGTSAPSGQTSQGLHQQLARARAEYDLGRPAESRALLETLVAPSADSDPRFAAELSLMRARIHNLEADYEEGRARLREAIAIADRHGLVETLIHAIVELVEVVPDELSADWKTYAAMGQGAASGSPALEFEVWQAIGRRHARAENWRGSRQAFDRAATVGRSQFGPEHQRTLIVEVALAAAAYRQGRRVEAVEELQRLVDELERVAAPSQFALASIWTTLATAYSNPHINRDLQALELFERALNVYLSASPDQFPRVAQLAARVEQRMTQPLVVLGRIDEAVERSKTALQRMSDGFGPRSLETAPIRMGYAALITRLGRAEEAAAELVLVRDSFVSGRGEASMAAAVASRRLAQALATQERFEESATEAERALQGYRKINGPDDLETLMVETELLYTSMLAGRPGVIPRLAQLADKLRKAGTRYASLAYLYLAQALHTSGRSDEAVAALKTARPLAQGYDPAIRIGIEFALAQALWDVATTPTERDEALKTADQALAEAQRVPGGQYEEIRQWLQGKDSG